MAEKKFPFDFMQCVEVVESGSYIRTAGDTFWMQKLAYHSASAVANAKVEYIGFANPGAGISASAWAIKRLTYDASGNVTDITWANSSLSLARMWDDRVSYQYG